MKNIIAIFFLSIYLISLTELHQLIKTPILVEHYQEHKAKNKDLSIIDFLILHYAGDNPKDADYDTDMKLPFKSHDGCLNAMVVVYVPCNSPVDIIKPVPTKVNAYFEYQESFISPTFLSSIWQPPKSC